ncbi:hypothetical protein AXG93_4123s1090 [Marchantia polymorpha subsp. ruderalis]|uniref:Reverse transcriptase domain-containing protein n=1 Tax=Marchantia polymorpha subsp. ruderalis TaxID=1480154 RepID=A0A176WKE6_MARPO|nr:hypothetical protein AXG93_4123s1090 [Marchantia polymorpha subsp. ruderalis]
MAMEERSAKHCFLLQTTAQDKEYQYRKIAGRQVQSRIAWKLRGDTVFKKIFRAVRALSTTNTIFALHNPTGTRVTDRQGLDYIVTNYYRKLYAAKCTSLKTQLAKDNLIGMIPASFTDQSSPSIRKILNAPPDAGELFSTLQHMAPGKSLVPDSILIKFYKHLWGLIDNEFAQMIHQAITDGAYSFGMTHGLVALILKDGDLEQLPNWRPITLLNTSYKILSKVLQIPLQLLLLDIIHAG